MQQNAHQDSKVEVLPLPALHDLLPEQHTLTVDERTRTLLLFSRESVQIEKFTPNGLRVLLPLLQSYPFGCTSEYLLYRLAGGNTSIETIRDHLEDAHIRGILAQELQPLQDILKNVRTKLASFSLTVSSVRGTTSPSVGYVLASLHLIEDDEKLTNKSLSPSR